MTGLSHSGSGPAVWLLGGTGDVGRQIVPHLLGSDIREIVTVSRRNHAIDPQATRLRYVTLDVTKADAALPIAPLDRVINLTEQTPPELTEGVIRAGGVFIETSASPDYVFEQREKVKSIGGPGVLVDCVGVAPGLTNLMAHEVMSRFRSVLALEIAGELGLGKHAGPAATKWFVQALGSSYEVIVNGRKSRVLPGQLRSRFQFDIEEASRVALGFPFVEQDVLAEEIVGRAKTVQSYLAFDPPAITRTLALLLRMGLGGFVSRHANLAVRLLLKFPEIGKLSTRIAVRAQPEDGETPGVLLFKTGDQSAATAAIVATAALTPLPTSATGPCLTIVDLLKLDEAISAVRAVFPETKLERHRLPGGTHIGTPNQEIHVRRFTKHGT